jgi:hypothetical protein
MDASKWTVIYSATLSLLEMTFVFRDVLVFCHFFLEKKVTKNSRLCRNPAILHAHYGGSEKNSPF